MAILFLVLGVLAIVGGIWLIYLALEEFYSLTLGIVGVILAIAGLSTALSIAIREIDVHISEHNCNAAVEKLGRKTKWVELGYFDYGCYVQTNNGLIPFDQVIGTEETS